MGKPDVVVNSVALSGDFARLGLRTFSSHWLSAAEGVLSSCGFSATGDLEAFLSFTGRLLAPAAKAQLVHHWHAVYGKQKGAASELLHRTPRKKARRKIPSGPQN